MWREALAEFGATGPSVPGSEASAGRGGQTVVRSDKTSPSTSRIAIPPRAAATEEKRTESYLIKSDASRTAFFLSRLFRHSSLHSSLGISSFVIPGRCC